MVRLHKEIDELGQHRLDQPLSPFADSTRVSPHPHVNKISALRTPANLSE